MERILKCVISVDGTVLVTKQNGFENENNAIKIVGSAVGFETYEKYIDFNNNGTILKSPNLSVGTKDFEYYIPQNLSTGILKYQFIFIDGETIIKSQVISIEFKESINATEQIEAEGVDILNAFEVRITAVESDINRLDIAIDNTIQDIFDKDLAINNKVDNYIESNDAALAQEISDRIAADETLYEDITQDIENAKQQVKDEIIGGAPEAFDTLLEIAAIFQNDPNLVATILNTLAAKVDKIAGKGLSTNDLTNELKAAYDAAVTNNHTHANKAVLDLITDLVKQGYDTAASQTHTHTDLATLNDLTAIWKLAVDDVVSRLAAKWMGTDINLNQIGLTHLTAALQQLIGSNNNITNYPDAVTIESYLDTGVNKLRIKDYGIDPTTKIVWDYTLDRTGLILNGGYLLIPANISDNEGCVEFLIKLNRQQAAIGYLIRFNPSGSIGLDVSITPSNNLIFAIKGNTIASKQLIVGNWYHVVVHYDFTNGNNKMYVNTVYINGNTSTDKFTLNINISVGANYGSGTAMDAIEIAYLNIYNYAPTGAEIKNMINYLKQDKVRLLHQYKAPINKYIITGDSAYFTNGIGLWQAFGGATFTNSNSNGILTLASTGGSGIKITGLFKPNKKYYLKIRIRLISGVAAQFDFGHSTDSSAAGAALYLSGIDSNFKIWQGYIYSKKTGDLLLFRYSSSNSSQYEIDYIECYEEGILIELKGENMGHITAIDTSGNGNHSQLTGSIYPIENPLIQKAWTGNFTTNIASGAANKDMIIPSGYMIETITLRNTTAGNITNFQAILNPASWNQTLFSGKTIAASATLEISQLADRYVDNVINMTLRFNCTGNGTGGIDIMVLLRRKD